MKTSTIKRVYVRHFTDNNTTVAYVDWADGSRTEGQPRRTWSLRDPGAPVFGAHMHALFARARCEGLRLERETW